MADGAPVGEFEAWMREARRGLSLLTDKAIPHELGTARPNLGITHQRVLGDGNPVTLGHDNAVRESVFAHYTPRDADCKLSLKSLVK